MSTTTQRHSKYTTVHKRVITETSKINISKDLYNQSWDCVLSTNDPDEKAERFQNTVSSVIDKHCPIRKVRTPVGKPPASTPLITKLKNAKRRAYAKNKIGSAWKFLDGILRKKIAEFQANTAQSQVNNTISGTRRWWKNVKTITGEQQQNTPSPYIHLHDQWLDLNEFCSSLNEHYVSIGGDLDITIPEIPASSAVTTVNVWDIMHVLRKINTFKSTQSEDYPSWVSKDNAEFIAESVTDIINSILRTGTYPRIWKKAEIAPLPKVSNPKECKDFRPISLLYHMSKVTEQFMNRELNKYIPEDHQQYAYTKNLGTTDALVKVITDIASSLDDKSTYAVQALYLDFSKAFDLMRGDILAEKLLRLKVPHTLVRLMLSFLSNRSQCVKVNGGQSLPLSPKLGVPQGTISGPTLWKVYVSDLKPSRNTIKYADDTTLYDTIRKKDLTVTDQSGRNRVITLPENTMQSAANEASSWSENNHQRLNAGKTQHMLFTLQLDVSLSTPITVNDEAIEQTPSAKLLGVKLDNHLNFTEHVASSIEKSRAAVYGLLTLKRHGIRSDLLVKFYLTRILPILTYACPAWFTYTTKTAKDRLERHQSLCLQIIYPTVKSYTERLNRAAIPRLVDTMSDLCSSYAVKIERNTSHRLNSLIPPRQSVNRRHSSRLANKITFQNRTALMNKSLFNTLS